MSTSLSRRIRRIGLLPQLSIDDVIDENLATKLKHAKEKASSGSEEAVAKLADLESDIARQLAPTRVRHLELTTEEVAAQTVSLRAAAKAKRVAARRATKGKNVLTRKAA